MPNRIFLHCGLHKTGSTALQQACSEYFAQLREQRVLYPQSGRLSDAPGHHNIAWELANDRRFCQRQGDLNALFSEIREFDGRVLLSSEDFESCLSRPKKLRPIVELAAELKRELFLVIYVRDQPSYLASLYFELLKHGFDKEYRYCRDQVVSAGVLEFKEWIFQFEYLAIAESLAAYSNVKLIFRNYGALRGNSVIDDLFAVAGIPAPMAELAGDIRANERCSLGRAIELWCTNRWGRKLIRSEQKVVAIFLGTDFSRANSSSLVRQEMTDKFSSSNKSLSDAFDLGDIELPIDSECSKTVGPVIDMDKVFSAETIATISRASTLAAKVYFWGNRQIEQKIDVIAADWRNWAQLA
jgi:hypothetical protein